MSVPDQLFTFESLGTLAGSAAAVWLVTAVIASIASGIPRWILRVIALVVSLALSYVVLSRVDDPGDSASLVAFFNGLLVYATAIGLNEMSASIREETSGQSELTANRNFTGGQPTNGGFFTRWW